MHDEIFQDALHGKAKLTATLKLRRYAFGAIGGYVG
jgi:hypothetical protein